MQAREAVRFSARAGLAGGTAPRGLRDRRALRSGVSRPSEDVGGPGTWNRAGAPERAETRAGGRAGRAGCGGGFPGVWRCEEEVSAEFHHRLYSAVLWVRISCQRI